LSRAALKLLCHKRHLPDFFHRAINPEKITSHYQRKATTRYLWQKYIKVT
jgi:hypothetical protein